MDSAFFLLSKLVWALARPDHLVLVLLSLGIWLSRPGRAAQNTRAQRWGRRLMVATLGGLWLLTLYPVGNLLLYPLETRFAQKTPPAERLAGVIVLGGAESLTASRHWGELQVNQHGERILALVALLERYPELPFIYTGGSGDPFDQRTRGADFVEAYLARLGLDERVHYERDSRNTDENARLSLPLAAEFDEGDWLLVTSAFHMPRSVGIFRRQGWSVVPYPVGHLSLPPGRQGWGFNFSNHLAELVIATREWLGLIAYRLTDKTDELLPDDE